MSASPRPAGPLVAIAVIAFAAVGFALFSQHRLEMLPCPWCILQRLIFVVIGVVALIGLVPAAATRVGAAALAVLLSLTGIATALYQHFVAAKSASCNLTFADKLLGALGLDSGLPWIFEPKATCADAAVNLFGVPYEFWSLALFVVIGVLAARAVRRA